MNLGAVFLIVFLIYRISCYLKKRKFNIYQEIGVWILFFYLVVVASVTLFKHGVFEFPIQVDTLKWRINLIPLVETIKMLTDGWVVGYSWYQVLANILVFIPLGFLLPILFKQFRQGLTVLLAGITGSLLIEIFQILTPRNIVDIDDIIFNTIGALLGYMVYLILIKIMKYFNLMRVLKRIEIHLTKPIIRVASVPFMMMLFTALSVSVIGYYESTDSNHLSDEELVANDYSYEGDFISKQDGKNRYILKEYDEYLDLEFYQLLPLNRVRKRSILQWHEEDGNSYSFTFLQDKTGASSKSRFVIMGKNMVATQIKITYLNEVYIEELPIGSFVVFYPHDIILDEEIYKLYDGEKSETFSVEFLNEFKEVIDCL